MKAAIFGVCLLVAGQVTSQPGRVVFEVASIRPNKTPSDIARWRVEPDGRYRGTRLTVQSLILTAYGIERFQLIGAPRWVVGERFDIVAKATGELTTAGSEPTFRAVLRALLKDRFKLVEHAEVRPFDVYTLKLARDDGRLGPNISRSTIDCAAMVAAEVRGERSGERSPCAVSAPGASGRFFAGSAPLSFLIGTLRMNVGRPVIDQTDLKGDFKMELTWASQVMPPALALLAAERPDQPLPSREGPSIFTAVQEQLGLKLEPTIASLKVVVIESVEHPSND